ncbi:MAG: amino acid ABC transporter periplasmic protein [Candidatus Magnetoglobus multicellularis str. Araruama]|uniref:Amino acid ABC transporter periplasmic protein n=1 Tax=Candidatus Magnetoglobus multicellularis str. Araruama TaxID=890399 RepID=A0A1V1PAY2_9BACT|nr:MAG: amino acid ABC transporter periplasmic protein [Candidatus Magnetoglobus multicellularis str. Araruama]
MFKHIISMIISIIIGIQCIQADEGRVVKVGGYHFPPFVVDDHEAAQGISIDFIHLLNNIQQKYTFDFFLTSSKRRFNHFNHGKYDMILFESIDWGWKNRNVDASIVYFEGGSKYITRAEPGKDQSYFNSFNGKSILLIHGYHYGFCNYQTDEQYLKKNFNASLTSTHEGNIRSVIRGRADMTVVILSFFQKFFA